MSFGNFLGFPQRDELKYKLEEGTNQLKDYVINNNVSGNNLEVERIMRYELYWKFYDGDHWRAFNETLLSFNYVEAFINKVNSFLVGDKPVTFKVTSYDNTKVEEATETALEGFIDYHWNKNKKSLLIDNALQTGAVTGDLFLLQEWMFDKDDKENSYVGIKVLDSRQCFPKFKDGNISELESFKIRIPLLKNATGYKVLVKEFTNTEIRTWWQKELALEPTTKYSESSEKNPYGFIPIVHIQNKPNSKGYFGFSDARDILKINKMYNEKAQDMNAIIDYYGTPTTVITGANAKGLVKSLGNIWSGLPSDANVYNLSLGEDLNGFVSFMKDVLKTGMHEIADVPENALGRLQAISNTSAAALQITYQPLVQQANKKALRYGEGFSEVNLQILKMSKIMAKDSKRVSAIDDSWLGLFKVEPVFSFGLPYDRYSDLQQGEIELRNNINSRRNIMNRLGIKDVPGTILEIDKDRENSAKIQDITVQE